MMDNWLGRSLKHKLSLLIIISVLVPVLSLGLFSYSIAEKLTEEKAINSGMNTLTLLGAYLDNMVRDAEFLSLYILGLRTFRVICVCRRRMDSCRER
ncbi:hypothetical protein [Paenibacillus sp. NPDC057967]|uniref:hypothetical protein n=1 Tax=Paenibacillus sp. NPDC057967 TaxID=3346293 RepID=UPI0036DC7B5F